MKLTEFDLKKLRHIAETAATEAGKLISAYAKKKFSTQNKKGGDSYASQVFTEVDLLSQKLILEQLSSSIKTYDLGLLTEESEDNNSRFEKDYFWCIDPLDGTLPFIEKSDGYSVSIALVSQKGIPLIGVIYDPCKQNLYSAIIDQGARKNNQVWTPINTSSIDKCSLTLVCDRSFLKLNNYSKTIENLKSISLEMGYKDLKTIKHGGAAMNAIWVLENTPACYFKYPKKADGGGSIWDYAASACIFNEVNAHASDSKGNAINLNRANSTFMNKDGILYASNKELANRVQKLILSNQ